jgi:excisionase family DNA binding protein
VHPHLITTREAADYLRCTLATVRNLIAAGKIEAYQIGKDWRVIAASVPGYVDWRVEAAKKSDV